MAFLATETTTSGSKCLPTLCSGQWCVLTVNTRSVIALVWYPDQNPGRRGGGGAGRVTQPRYFFYKYICDYFIEKIIVWESRGGGGNCQLTLPSPAPHPRVRPCCIRNSLTNHNTSVSCYSIKQKRHCSYSIPHELRHEIIQKRSTKHTHTHTHAHTHTHTESNAPHTHCW